MTPSATVSYRSSSPSSKGANFTSTSSNFCFGHRFKLAHVNVCQASRAFRRFDAI